jgi:hypothetical protein
MERAPSSPDIANETDSLLLTRSQSSSSQVSWKGLHKDMSLYYCLGCKIFALNCLIGNRDLNSGGDFQRSIPRLPITNCISIWLDYYALLIMI